MCIYRHTLKKALKYINKVRLMLLNLSYYFAKINKKVQFKSRLNLTYINTKKIFNILFGGNFD